MPPAGLVTWSLREKQADLFATNVRPQPDGIAFELRAKGKVISPDVVLRVPGRHNLANALAALGACQAAGVGLEEAARALETFTGIRRRLEVVGRNREITFIDDFAHNPDKIAATLETLHEFPGRVLLMFQPHGFGPLRLMKQGFIETFSRKMAVDDVLLMPEPVYFGGTGDRSVSSEDIASGVRAGGRQAYALADRAACGERIAELSLPCDRILVMRARDDTLSQFSAELLRRLSED